MTRLWLILLLHGCVPALLGGCWPVRADETSADVAEPPGAGGGADGADALQECLSNMDCELAGSSCCECPSIALPTSDGFGGACNEVECQLPAGCAAVEAVCEQGRCTLRCSPVACDLQCEGGFMRDELGCLVCACQPLPPLAECAQDMDCARVPADCCGCARGGQDSSVPTSRVEDHLDGLGCPQSPACPEVNICDQDLVPRCMAGQCRLGPASPADGPAMDGPTGLPLCGTPELPSCITGQCVLNHPGAEDAARAGTGVCLAP